MSWCGCEAQPKVCRSCESIGRTQALRLTLASYHPIAQGVVTLLLCTRVVQVRSGEHGKRWCFDVVSPYRSYTLQARHLAT